MANKYDIIHIDFQASARGANAAIESIRTEAQKTSDKITALKKSIEEGVAAKLDQHSIDGMRSELKSYEKRYKQLTQAQNELIKGMRVLDEGVKQFNSGALSQMNAAFQKSVNNAAKLAQSKMATGTKEWREMGAIMQETEQNYARMQRDTDQLILNLQNGGTVFRKTLEDEKKGLNDLLQVLPYMGTEYRKVEEQLQFLVKTTDEMTIKERQLKGEIVTTNDARRVRMQLTKEGAEAARQAAEAAQVEIDKGKQQIETLEKEQSAIEARAKASAEAAAKYTEDLQMYDDYIKELDREIDKDKKAAKARKEKAEQLSAEADSAMEAAKKQREAQKLVDQAYDETATKVANLKQQLKDLKAGVTTEAPKADPTTEAIKTGAQEASAELTELEEKLKKLAEYKTKRQQIVDEFEAKYGKTEEERYAAQRELEKNAQRKDFASQDEAIKKLEQKWNTYWEKQEAAAKQFAESIGKSLEDLGFNDIVKHLEGPMADKAKSAYKVVAHKDYELGEALGREGELYERKTFAQRYEGNDSPEAKVIESLQRKYNEYINSLRDAKKIQTEYIPVHKALTEESNAYLTALGELQGAQEVEMGLLKEKERLTQNDATATKQQTETKQEEVKVEEQAVETQKQEAVTIEQLRGKNDALKASIEELRKEKEKLIEEQEKSAKASKAEGNAFKDLTQEQAKAMLEQKQQLATFKIGEGGKWEVTNREEAQKYIFDALGEIDSSYFGSTRSEGKADNAAKLIGKFKERYGMQSEDDAMNAMREVMQNGGLIKMGAINKNFFTIEQDVQKLGAYEKEIADLTQVIKGEVKVVGEDAAAKQRLAEIDEELAKKEAESAELSKLTGKVYRGEIELTNEQIKNTENLAEARKKNAEAAKSELDAIKNLSKEEADEMRAKMTAKSTLKFSKGKLEASNLEQVQTFILSQAKKVNPDTLGRDGKVDTSMQKGHIQVGLKTLSHGKNTQFDRLFTAFKKEYGLEDLSKKDAQDLFKQVITAEGGFFKKGAKVDFSAGQMDIPYDVEALKARAAKLQELINVSKKATETTEELTDATQEGTEASNQSAKATEGQADAVTEIERLYKAWQDAEEEYNKKYGELKRKREAKKNLPKSGPDAELQRAQLEEEIEDLNNAVTPLRTNKNALKKLYDKAISKARTTEEDTQATENNTQATERNTKAKKDSAKASEEEIARKQKEAEIKEQLAQAEKELGEAEKKKKEEEVKTTKADREAIAKVTKAADAQRTAGGKAEEYLQEQNKMKQEREQLMADNKDTLKDNETNQKQLADINEKLKEQTDRIRENEQIKAQANTEGIEKTEQAIRLLQEENRHIDTNGEQWKKNTQDIQALQAALDEMKGKPTLMLMEERMKNIGELSSSAVTETKRFWETMAAGAEKGSEKLKVAEANVTALIEEERKRSQEQAGKVIGNMGSYSDKEIADAVKTFEQLRDAQTHGNDEWRKFNELAQQGKAHLEEMAKADALAKMEGNMQNLTTLSETALSETKKFWEAMAAGASKGSAELKTAEANLKAITDLEKERANTANRDKADVLLYGTLKNYSEREIREAIEAAKAFRNELATGDKDAERYAEAIAKAEAHIKKFGVETARAAQKQKESDDLMRSQLTRMFNDMYTGAGMPSESQLKAQKQYWQRLIDDPKTAASSLNEYRNALADVEKMEADMVKIGGQTALAWFGQGSDKNASENQIKEMAAKLKEYRGTLLQETNADEINQIDAILQKVGVSAKKAAEDVMSLDDALDLAEKAFNDIYGAKTGTPAFFASPEEIQAATKSIENYREELFKTIKAKRDMGQSTEAEEEMLKILNDDLKALKFNQDNFNMSREKMEELMKNPTSAANLDELRAAIKRADGELKRMEGSLGKNKDEYKAFAKQVKEAKNVLKDMEGQARATSSVWEKAWSRLKTYVGMYMGFNMAWQRVTGSFEDLMQLSDKMGEVRKTTGFTADEVGRLSENLKKLDVRTPLTELMTISAKAGQLGLKSQEDVMGFTEAANKLMIALPEMGAEAATEMMKVAIATGEVKKIQEQLDKGIIDGSSATEVALTKVGSTIDQLRANSAAAAPAITDFVKRVGAVGAQSGITIDQVAALGATVDALGMRVEMSATALSRMIPAIRNNAFQVANAIGMAPNALRAMFDEAGGGMEAMLAIFQHIKDSGMDADSIEHLLGMGGLKDVMKELNQQGARAGIVFAGLSQNVDELRKNLVTARDAYEDNIAILQEYNKMNETTAAKWERFKNQIEETFVGDTAQRWLGHVIDLLRGILDLFTGNHGIAAAIRTIVVYLGLVKLNIAGALTGTKAWNLSLSKIAVTLGFIDKETKKIQWGNIFTALAAAALYAWHEISMMKTALERANEALGKTKEEVGFAIDRFEGYWIKIKDTSAALQQARTSHEQLSAEVDKLRKSTDGSAESTANLKKKEDELEKSEINVARASNDHRSAISQMNSIYGKYLGFILTETNYANLAAAAHDKVAAAIEREMLVKQRQAAIGDVDSNYSQDIAKGYGDLNERLVNYGKLERRDAARAMSDMQRFMRENLKYDASTNTTTVSKAITDQLKKSGFDVSKANANEIAALWFDQYLEKNFHISAAKRKGITGVARDTEKAEGWSNIYTPFATNLRGGYADTYAQRERDRGAVSAVYGVDIEESMSRESQAAGDLLRKLEKSAQDAKKVILDKKTTDADRNKAYGELANALEGLENRVNELDPQKDAATINRLNDMAKALKGEGIDIKKLKIAREKIHQTLFERATFNEEDIRNLDTNNPWGSSHEASSTDWKNMTAEQLVNRRKQMNEFVKAIQTDSDVQSVLGEDAALKKAIEKGMSSDMRTVINWYNTERLKIQDELHARYLTNTGAWQDPKQSRARRKRLQDDMRAFLEELDAYYTERNQEIEKAKNEEEITEAEAWRRTIKNEEEWYKRRAELQIMYSNKHQKIAADEQQAIAEIIAERTGDTADFIMATIGNTRKFSEAIKKVNDQGAKEYRKFQGDLDLGAEKSYLKSAKSIGKYMKFIEDTLAKERPYDSITKNLQENLDKMGILAAQYKRINDELTAQGKEAKYSNEQITAATYDEMAFFLKQAENAWSIDIDELLRRMVQEGMVATAEEISKSEMLKQAVMGQLRKTFEEVQNAVKREATQIKKDVEIIWNDDTMGMGGLSMKAAFDKAVAQLGQQQDSVSRANSLIGAGAASENVAARLGLKQIEVQMRMQKAQFDMYRAQANQRIIDLRKEAAEHKRIAELEEKAGHAEEAAKERLKETIALRDAENVRKSLGLTLSEETKKEEEQKTELLKLQEESQNRLYTSLREWADLFSSGMQSMMEASHAGDAEYYNELAKMRLTGKGGPGAGTYIIIDNEGTSDARAHYEYLDQEQALERQREIENENAMAEAWEKLWDDLNMKLNDQITDWINASMQNESIDANTQAVIANTLALYATMGGKSAEFTDVSNLKRNESGQAVDDLGMAITPIAPTGEQQTEEMPKAPWQMTEDELSDAQGNLDMLWQGYKNSAITAMQEMTDASAEMPETVVHPPYLMTEEQIEESVKRTQDLANRQAQAEIDASKKKTDVVVSNAAKEAKATKEATNNEVTSTSSAYSKMAAACNMYGLAYQTVTNDNLDASQKFQMFALQAAGQTAIGMLTTDLFLQQGKAKVELPGILGKAASQLGPIAGPIAFAAMTALLGGLMGLAVSQVGKSKSQIAQVTGASVGAGRLSTGMLTYAEGNVNEFTDPATLTPGRSYNVDGADGKTYRAKYTGTRPTTHLTNGPEFHLAGEKGREMIIDAGTTRQITMNDNEIWKAIKTLSGGGRVQSSRRRRSGVRAFAEGNVDDFETIDSGAAADELGFDPAALQASIDRNSEVMERALTEGIKGVFNVYGPDGLVAAYDKGKKNASRHGEKY